ncbi:MAG: diguanylate cyclase [Magnetococcales bacterium]|nr:diguanylate cyclase [Magnetococcales bacterium]
MSTTSPPLHRPTMPREPNAEELEHALEVAHRIWWVGHHFTDDPFQCHPYLIEHGDQSVLLDPGSVLTFSTTLRKIEEVIPLSSIRYIICHHQDPDITGILPQLDTLITREDARILSHWRGNALLKHLGLQRLPLSCVEEQGWKLELGGRELQFIFTPYLHFSGAFCTFDPATGTLFSSDLFGGLSRDTPLFARDERAFEAIQVFHEHYMPSQEILRHGLANLETLPIRLIAPQHGSLIPEPLVGYMFTQLKNLDCGLFLLTRTNSNYQRLSNLNRMLREMMQTLMIQRNFSEVASRILELAQPLIPTFGLEFFALTETDEILYMAPENGFRATLLPTAPAECRAFLGISRAHWQQDHAGPYLVAPYPGTALSPGGEAIEQGLILPLFSPQNDLVQAVVLFRLSAPLIIDDGMAHILTQLSIPLGVAVEREIILHRMDLEKKNAYERSIRDPLTGLFTRYYMHEAMNRLTRIHDRDSNASIALLAFDIDHFKSVNDTYGHAMGDVTLRVVAKILADSVRGVDIPVRLGGEEFVIFLIGAPEKTTQEVAERIRMRVQKQLFEPPMHERNVTISCGIAFRQIEEPIEQTMERADLALYQAKTGGRNRVVVSATPPPPPG